MNMTHISLDVLVILRDALREKGRKCILSENEYDALLHANAKINAEKNPVLHEENLKKGKS